MESFVLPPLRAVVHEVSLPRRLQHSRWPAGPVFAMALVASTMPKMWFVAAVLVTGVTTTVFSQLPNAFEDDVTGRAGESSTDDAIEPGVLLPGDRSLERQLDRSRRLVADGRWSDAAATLDELLASDLDAFVVAGTAATRGSIRSAAAALVDDLPRPGRDAYRLLFSSRAAKQLAAAIAADDTNAIVGVARRWFQTPAGRDAAMLTAVLALEAGQPMAAAAWLDRLATSSDAVAFEPTLSVMRALARSQAGDERTAEQLLLATPKRGQSGVRLGGRDQAIAATPQAAREWLAEQGSNTGGKLATGRDWRQFRGGAARNDVVEASCPLLVPRYRVPLVRHPEEARLLERRRRDAADADEPLLPAGTPLAVGERLVVQTPLGILAIDFESGRRVWLESAVSIAEVELTDDEEAPAAEDDNSMNRVFDDATSGNLASDGRLVFAVESPPAALLARSVDVTGFGRGLIQPGDHQDVTNTLSAYSIATGKVRWRLPAAADDTNGEEETWGRRWHLGPPLVAGDELFLLVESQGEVQLEVRAAADASLIWSQPLATYDDGETIVSVEARPRRLAGLSPALDQGLLICPIGGGCVVAVDVVTRSLAWAHAYKRVETEGGRRGGRRPGPWGDEASRSHAGEPTPVITAGCVILAPFDAEELLCLNLRDGELIWKQPRQEASRIAGAVDGRVFMVGDADVSAIDIATGKQIWRRDLGDGVRPSGRGILTPQSLLLPSDAPAVIEMALADGRIVGRSLARGGRIPGNLVAHRGEIISRGVDAIDVFHQEAALDARIETALLAAPASPWAAYWRGQAAIEMGNIEAGLGDLATAADSSQFRIPPGDLSEAIVQAMRRDFPATIRSWKTLAGDDPAGASPAVARMAVDGFLAMGDSDLAWNMLQPLLSDSAPVAGDADGLFRDASDPRLLLSMDRWIQGRLVRLYAAAAPPLRSRIDEACDRLVRDARELADPEARRRRLEVAHERLGSHPAATTVRQALIAASKDTDSRQPTVRKSVMLAGLAAASDANRQAIPEEKELDATANEAWPLGRVEIRQAARGSHRGRGFSNRSQLFPIPLMGAGGPGTRAARAAVDIQRQRLVITDHFGRPVTDPLPVEGLSGGMPFFNQRPPLEVTIVGRICCVRSSAGIIAYDLDAPTGAGRGLWRRRDVGAESAESASGWGIGLGVNVPRDGAVPLGMRIVEPDNRPRGSGRGMIALPMGLAVPGPRSIALLDPVSGQTLWERHQLPAGLQWIGDREFLCGCTGSGRGSVVLQASDGRLLHSWDVPHRRQRLAIKGRRFVAVGPLEDFATAGFAERVRLDLIDPVDQETRLIGEFAGESRAVETDDGRLAVLEPGGLLTLFDLADGSLVFQCSLAETPQRFERLHVEAWQDRYLVFAGSNDDEPDADIAPLEQLLLSGGGNAAPLSGAIWAIDKRDGKPLWPVPAVIQRHCLHTAQPTGLPILTFCRLLQRRGDNQASLSLLCIDKRTGHAVFENDRFDIESALPFSCDIAGDPQEHTITIGDERTLVLAFTGRPIAPQPPFQSQGRLPSRSGSREIWKGPFERPRPRGLEALLAPDDLRPRPEPQRDPGGLE